MDATIFSITARPDGLCRATRVNFWNPVTERHDWIGLGGAGNTQPGDIQISFGGGVPVAADEEGRPKGWT